MGIERVESSDAELVRRIRTGDIGAYGALVSRYRDRLGRYALHMLGDREDAEEALQDSFVRAYRSLARCDDPARFGAWLYGILVNRCRTSGARAARRRRMFVRDADALHGAAHADQSDRQDLGKEEDHLVELRSPDPGHSATAPAPAGHIEQEGKEKGDDDGDDRQGK